MSVIVLGRQVLNYVTGMTYGDFIADRKTVDAVVRNLIIIDEASVHIPGEICTSQRGAYWNAAVLSLEIKRLTNNE
jgi:uncharacterized protein with HEPN domain